MFSTNYIRSTITELKKRQEKKAKLLAELEGEDAAIAHLQAIIDKFPVPEEAEDISPDVKKDDDESPFDVNEESAA